MIFKYVFCVLKCATKTYFNVEFLKTLNLEMEMYLMDCLKESLSFLVWEDDPLDVMSSVMKYLLANQCLHLNSILAWRANPLLELQPDIAELIDDLIIWHQSVMIIIYYIKYIFQINYFLFLPLAK